MLLEALLEHLSFIEGDEQHAPFGLDQSIRASIRYRIILSNDVPGTATEEIIDSHQYRARCTFHNGWCAPSNVWLLRKQRDDFRTLARRPFTCQWSSKMNNIVMISTQHTHIDYLQ